MMCWSNKIRRIAIVMVMTLCSQYAWASAVKAIRFRPQKVYTLTLSPLYSTVIKLQGIKKISSIHCGDANAWEVLPSVGTVNSLVVKPLVEHSKTDLIIRADKYDLLFKIQAQSGTRVDPLLFVTVSFPKGKPPFSKASKKYPVINRYCYRGDPLLRPSWAYDNGEAMYVHWGRYRSVPAIYRIASARKEASLVNFRVRDNVFRIPVLSDQWLLRKGNRVGALVYFDPQGRRCND